MAKGIDRLFRRAGVAARMLSRPDVASRCLRQSFHSLYVETILRKPIIPQRPLSDLFDPKCEIRMQNFFSRDGNVSCLELAAILAAIAQGHPLNLLEIGTFDGNTTLQMALNSDERAVVHTLDLPEGHYGSGPQVEEDLKYMRDKKKLKRRYQGTAVEAKVRSTGRFRDLRFCAVCGEWPGGFLFHRRRAHLRVRKERHREGHANSRAARDRFLARLRTRMQGRVPLSLRQLRQPASDRANRRHPHGGARAATKRMIIVRLKAGLGNQLFEYAAGLRLARRHQTTLKLDIEEDPRETHRTPGWLPGYERKPQLDLFHTTGTLATGEEADRLRDPFRPSVRTPLALSALDRRWRPKFGYPRTHVRENGHGYDPAILELPDDCYLEGFWQTEKYFLDAAEQVRAEFTPRDSKLQPYAREYVGRLRNGSREVVSLHVRRGDLAFAKEVLNDRKGVHGEPVAPQYAHEAMKRFGPETVFLVFSDSAKDVAWCRENIRGENLAFSEGHTDLQDFELMRECDHNIIANSTFSWWAAWLNHHRGRRVIAPKNWFYSSRNGQSRDIIPAAWRPCKQMAAPLFSIVMPTCNRAALLRAALDSVLAQEFTDYEIIVVDGGSTDETPALLAALGTRVKVVEQREKQGPGQPATPVAARQRANTWRSSTATICGFPGRWRLTPRFSNGRAARRGSWAPPLNLKRKRWPGQ